MIAYPLDAIEVELAQPTFEVPEIITRAMHEAGFTSLAVRHAFEPSSDITALPCRSIVVGVGVAKQLRAKIPGGTVKTLQAFAIFVPVLAELNRMPKQLSIAAPWRCYGAKTTHLPQLAAPDSQGRWFICYAPMDARLLDGIEFAHRSGDLGRDQRV
jgi:hypothetical protein